MNDVIGEVTVGLEVDGGRRITLSETDRPVELLRTAASLLERYAASIEREQEPISCETCGATPTGVEATPSGQWRFLPCGHGVPAAGGAV